MYMCQISSCRQVIKDLNTNEEMVAWTLSIFALGNGTTCVPCSHH